MNDVKPYQPKHSIRLVTAASLFDGHDASINIMRRILQSSGAEVIHLGHDRSAEEVVNTAIEEDANGIALTSYQGGHLEYFKYMRDLLVEKGAGHIQIFGGGGGTILPNEIEELQAYGICRIYHPDDGRSMGLQGMINDLLEACDFPLGGQAKLGDLTDSGQIARLISCAENFPAHYQTMRDAVQKRADKSHAPVLGITGTGGAGKSSLVDEMVRRFLSDQPGKRIALISVDPSKRRTGGALLGDRIRMNSINHPDVYMRSLATRQSNLALSRHVSDALRILQAANFDLIILETSGIGQSDTEILEHSDVSLYVMTPEYGAATQLEKIDMLDFADLIALNKFDKLGALDGLRDVKKQVQRNRNAFDVDPDTMPVYGTMASQFNDPGANQLYRAIMDELVEKAKADHLVSQFVVSDAMSEKVYIIPPKRTRYLSEIAESIRSYNDWVVTQSDTADALYSLRQSAQTLADSPLEDKDRLIKQLDEAFALRKRDLDPYNWDLIAAWSDVRASYKAELYTYTVRGKDIK
ncbi:MAG: cobalamin-dependent protein, partial [Schleiferiaceae bacterium]|nr:cobalamin-dependent protein [Schleiferiaceae bacterium]